MNKASDKSTIEVSLCTVTVSHGTFFTSKEVEITLFKNHIKIYVVNDGSTFWVPLDAIATLRLTTTRSLLVLLILILSTILSLVMIFYSLEIAVGLGIIAIIAAIFYFNPIGVFSLYDVSGAVYHIYMNRFSNSIKELTNLIKLTLKQRKIFLSTISFMGNLTALQKHFQK
ncbi:MAG: hypothetical protein QM538_05675 [Methylacidiphilales bacterium]|nr:hypothetical protein [Candidatus Methylacidiphilales bacterium]